MTMHTDETWAAHRRDRAGYDALHARLDEITDGMRSVTNPEVRELLGVVQVILRDLLDIPESDQAEKCAHETIQACDVCGLVDHHCRSGACPECNRRIQEAHG